VEQNWLQCVLFQETEEPMNRETEKPMKWGRGAGWFVVCGVWFGEGLDIHNPQSPLPKNP